MLIDTHTHLYANQFEEDRTEMIQRALDVGVEHFFLPNIDLDSIDGMYALEAAYPGQMHPMMGLHPCSVAADYKQVLEQIKSELDKRSFVAIGEIGMDLYWDKTYKKEQEAAFLMQVEWAEKLDIPIVIHSRETTQLLIDVLEDYGLGRSRGIFHCFGGSYEEAKQIIDLGYDLGIGGVLTFKKSGLSEVLEKIPLKHLVLETDSPYLSPTPKRGKRNESAFIAYIAQKLADIKQVPVEELARITSENASRIFKI
jgi:TatD DNase family protein